QFRDAVVPDGMFVIQERASSAWVGTISAVHNPAATRFYFPGGGELGYLLVAPEHRRRGLGAALITAALRRLHHSGYRHICLGCRAGGSLRFKPMFESGSSLSSMRPSWSRAGNPSSQP